MSAAPRSVLVGAFVVVLAACADFSSSQDPTSGLPDVLIANPSLATNIQPIFDKRCAQGGCHTPAVHQAGLDLTAGASDGNLVNVTSTLAGPMKRVLPADHANSYLWVMLQPDDALRPLHPRMPLAAQPLTANQLQNIVTWIDQGALNN